MFDIGNVAMDIAGLEVKPSKCAVMYARRSGNNWYKGKADKSQLCQFKEMPSKFIPVISPISILENLSHFPAKILCRCWKLYRKL